MAVVLLCGLAVASCGTSGSGADVTVLGPWTGQEASGFAAMFAGFEKSTGIDVRYIGTRDADAVLASEIENGDPPDAAVLSTPGELRQYAAAGRLVPLDRVPVPAGAYTPAVRALTVTSGPGGDPHPYAIIIKAALKSVIWYSPRTLPPALRSTVTAPDLTWQRLADLRLTWCMGVADTSSSGWPGTDWVEDLLLHRSGPRKYDQWVAGRLPWTSPEVRDAWRAFGAIAAKAGGTDHVLLTGFGQAGAPMFAPRPGCLLDHEGSFITAFYSGTPGTEYDFVPFPPAGKAGQGAQEIAGDLLGIFHGTSAARRLAAYLTTRPAQEAWARRLASGAYSLNRQVPIGVYPDPVAKKIATGLTHAGTVRFDGSDSMPQTMASAFDNAVLEYLAAPDHLDALLSALDKVRSVAY
ncbi:ABC transporter substrate-binding protein [Actinomadura sp. DC4]|uniref:ABC transporter substrate-binding protein n=1 Tax=Actinomadura sp. DC4 TaxID=3055069 RepID=UPI0025B02644|nr:ABC transporter substrate-binding protein [Actinomadura sp. DC4]MDN3353793.1 ABC transporter substrate-binding protein [Actinomadura sp. DC4]